MKEERIKVEEEVKLKAIFDCKTNKCLHFTIGKTGDKISGGLYTLQNYLLPKRIIIEFNHTRPTAYQQPRDTSLKFQGDELSQFEEDDVTPDLNF